MKKSWHVVFVVVIMFMMTSCSSIEIGDMIIAKEKGIQLYFDLNASDLMDTCRFLGTMENERFVVLDVENYGNIGDVMYIQAIDRDTMDPMFHCSGWVRLGDMDKFESFKEYIDQ